MIIFGSKETNTGHQQLFNSKCSYCETKGNIEMHTFSRYFHVFWIPFLPYQRYAITRCEHCKQVLHKREFSPELLNEYEQMKVNTKKAYWQFTGLGLFIVLITLVIYSVKEDDKRDILYLTTPQPDDIYEIHTSGIYTLYKVNKVTADSVYVLLNKFEADKRRGLRESKMNGPGSYIEQGYLPIAKKELLKMKDKNEIQAVRRN